MTEALGVVPPCITFFNEAGQVDRDRTQAHLEWLIDAGVDGVLGIGTCGEFYALELSEREQLASDFVAWADGRIPVYIGVMHTSTDVAIRLARSAEESGASAVMSVAPYYGSPPEREVLGYFRDLAGAVDIPLIVYNNPGASGVSMSVQALAELAEDGTASVIKESHGDPARIHDLRLVVPESTRVVYGEDYGAFEAIMGGADGWVAGVGNFMPRQAVRLWQLASAGDVGAAREHWYRILPLVNMTSHKPMFGRPQERPDYVQIYKSALDLLGLGGGPVRRPLLPLLPEDVAYLEQLMKELRLSSETA
jgi:4-hydroxy-tetrahydrodipicolinate synthase